MADRTTHLDELGVPPVAPPAADRPQAEAARPRGRAGAVLAPVLLPLLGLAVAVSAWWAATVVFDIGTVVPAPPEVLDELVRLHERLLEQARFTLIEITVGFAITAAVGLVVGTVIAHSRTLDLMVSPWLVAFNAVPKVAFAPLLLIWLGFDTQPRIAMVILIAFFPVVLSTYTGLSATPAELVELGRSMNGSRWRTFWKVRLPHALPQIFVGLKVAMPLAAVGAVVGEFAGGKTGLGYTIKTAGASGNTPLVFAAITVVSVMSILLFYALVLLERRMLPWMRATTG